VSQAQSVATNVCPQCGGTNRVTQRGEYVLLQLTGTGTHQLELRRGAVEALICAATTCRDCGFVALTDSEAR
jgi:hypothetical protein